MSLLVILHSCHLMLLHLALQHSFVAIFKVILVDSLLFNHLLSEDSSFLLSFSLLSHFLISSHLFRGCEVI